MKGKIFLIFGLGILIFSSCSSVPEKTSSLSSFFFLDGSRGPVCWLVEKSGDSSELNKKMICYDFLNEKVISEINVRGDSYFPPDDSIGRGFIIQSGDRIWLLFDSNKLEARNIYNWEILEDNKSFEKKYAELKSGIKLLLREFQGQRLNGFDIISNDEKKYYYDRDQLLIQPYEAWVGFNKKEIEPFYSFNYLDPYLSYSTFNELTGQWNHKIDSVDGRKKYIDGRISGLTEKVTLVLGRDDDKKINLDCYENKPMKFIWRSEITNQFQFSGKILKDISGFSCAIKNGKILLQDNKKSHSGASYNLSDGKLLWSANADSLFKFVIEKRALGNRE